MGKYARPEAPAAKDEERVRALNRETHEAAQELKDGLRDLAAFVGDLEENVANLVEKRLAKRLADESAAVDAKTAKILKKLDEGGDEIQKELAKVWGVKTWDEAMDYLCAQLVGDIRDAVLEAFIGKSEPMVREVLDLLVAKHLDAVKREWAAGMEFKVIPKSGKTGVAPIVTKPI